MRLVHSESGNCGHLAELSNEALVSFGSQEKFLRVSWVHLSELDKGAGSSLSRITHAKVEVSIFRLVGTASDSAD